MSASDTTQRALDDVAAERRRQMEQEGWTPEHDDAHHDNALARAAAVYAAPRGWRTGMVPVRGGERALWPWDLQWYKPATVGIPGERRRELVRAGALIIAEIERLDRATTVSPRVRRDGGAA
jgi:hypothetical protein